MRREPPFPTRLDSFAVSCQIPAHGSLSSRSADCRPPTPSTRPFRPAPTWSDSSSFRRSPRYVSLDRAASLADRARNRAEIVVLVVDADDDVLAKIVEGVRPDWLQLHGGETPERVADIRKRFGIKVMKAIGIREAADLEAADRYAAVCRPPASRRQAAEGRASPRRQCRHLRLGDPRRVRAEDFLAPFRRARCRQCRGGACASVGAPGVDVSSGVEIGAGRQGCRPDPRLRRRSATHGAGASERKGSRHDRPAEHLPHRPGRARLLRLYGGRFVAETLMPLILELETAYEAAKNDPAFQAELDDLNTHYAGRPSPLYFAERLTAHLREVSALRAAARRSTSSATSSTTPAATRSTTASARSCWPGAWARRASSPRPAPASTASPPRPSRPASACPASSTWARPTSSGRSRTSSA